MSPAAAALVPLNVKPRVEMLALELIDESPTNPRHQAAEKQADVDLAASIKEKGVLQPVLTRPVGDRYELVFGHRRLRAAKKAGLLELPAMVREMSDREALEAQLIENRDRADVHPLDEADAIQSLHKDYSVPIEEIVAKLGKSRSYVYLRLSLCKLTSLARKKFLAGELSARVAQLLAQVPENLQKQAVEKLTGWNGGGTDFRQAQGLLEREFALRLADAPWKLDEALGQKPCTTCPSRSVNQREMFDDASKEDLCTDPACFKLKKEAHWERTAAAAREAGQVVLEGAAAKKLFDYGDQIKSSADVVGLDSKVDPHDYGPKAKTWRQLLGKQAPTPILVQGDDGKPLEVLDKAAAKSLVKKLGLKVKVEREPSGGSQETVLRKKLELRKKVVMAAAPELVARARRAVDKCVVALFAEAMKYPDPAAVKSIAPGFKIDCEEPADELRGMNDCDDMIAAMFSLHALSQGAQGSMYSDQYGVNFVEAMKVVGLDLKKYEAQVKASAKEKKGKDKSALVKKVKGGAAAAAKETLCAVPGCGLAVDDAEQPLTGQLADHLALFCGEHLDSLSLGERKSILARNKRFADTGLPLNLGSSKKTGGKK